MRDSQMCINIVDNYDWWQTRVSKANYALKAHIATNFSLLSLQLPP